MDPITVLGAAGSLVNLIDATGALAKKLHRLARGVRAARKNIRKFARKLSMFSWASNQACDCLLQHYSSKIELGTLSNIQEKNFLKDAEVSAREIMRDVQDITPRMRSMKSSLGLFAKIKWATRKSEVRDLTLEMSALETSLTLLMTTVIYEVQIQQGAAPEALARTMAQITNFIEGADVIASKFDKLAGAQSATEKTLQRLLGNVIYVADDQLDVADTAREATGLYEPGRWELKKEADPISHENRRRRRSGIETRPQERSPRRTRPEERRTRSPRPPRPSNEGIFINISPLNQPKGKGRQTDREPPEASSSRGVENPAGSNRLDSQNAIVVTENDQSTQHLETHLPQGAALPYFEGPSASDEYLCVSGEISQTKSRDSRSSSRTITARLYSNFGMNAISRAMAEQLGLNITVHFDRDFARNLPVTGATQAEVNHAVGHVTFVWETAAHMLIVLCTVVEQEVLPGVPIALGKPYTQQVETAGGVVRGESFRTSAAS